MRIMIRSRRSLATGEYMNYFMPNNLYNPYIFMCELFNKV